MARRKVRSVSKILTEDERFRQQEIREQIGSDEASGGI